MLKLFVGDPNSISIASHITLEELALPYELHRVNYRAVEQRSAAYLSINPKGRVPALATAAGILTETPAILTYLALQKPDAGLVPDPPASFSFARLQSFMAYLCSTVHPAHAHRMRGNRWSDDPVVIEGLKVKVRQNMMDCFSLIEAEYLSGPWVMGDQFSVADPYLFAITQWMEDDGVSPSDFPKLLDHRTRMKARPATAKALAFYASAR